MARHRAARIATVILLTFGCVFYLQFGLQALAHHLPQGILSLIGAVALGWGAVKVARRRSAAPVVSLGTFPVLLLHAVMTVADPGELPFLIGSVPAPTIAGVSWLFGRLRRSDGRGG